MTKDDIKNIEHFAYPIPFTQEIKELGLQPYRTNDKLEEKIRFIFSHPKFIYRDEFIKVSEDGSKGLVKDMAVKAVGVMRYYLMYPQRFGHRAENIHLQILVRMWRQVFRHKTFQRKENEKYLATKMMLLTIDNDLIETLIETCESGDYIQHGDDMLKKQGRKKTKKVQGMKDGSRYFEFLCRLE